MQFLWNLWDRLRGRATYSVLRSPEWPRLRKAHLKVEPTCQCCGGTKGLQVHHVVPVHVDPSRELDPTNLITLCTKRKGLNCHFAIGHRLNWQKSNQFVRTDCEFLLARFRGE